MQRKTHYGFAVLIHCQLPTSKVPGHRFNYFFHLSSGLNWRTTFPQISRKGRTELSLPAS